MLKDDTDESINGVIDFSDSPLLGARGFRGRYTDLGLSTQTVRELQCVSVCVSLYVCVCVCVCVCVSVSLEAVFLIDAVPDSPG